jgi:hypothetical protein
MLLTLSYVSSSVPSASPAIMPADFVLRDAPAWRVAQDSYQLIRRPWHEHISTQGNPQCAEFIRGLRGAASFLARN